MSASGPGGSYAGKRVTIIGLGIEGVSLAKYLGSRAASVTVSDSRSEAELADRLRELDGLPVELSLGQNDPATSEAADVVFVSQSVPLDNPAVLAARARRVPVSSVTDFFVKHWQGPIAAITGSAGKTTTTSLVDAMFTAAEEDHVLVGNIGAWPLDELDRSSAGRWAVMEISHTQLQLVEFRPRVACITNITPNHLDRFTWDEYVALKRNLIRIQGGDDWAVLNYDDDEGWAARAATQGRVAAFSRSATPSVPATYISGGAALTNVLGATEHVFDVSDLKLRGLHNLENALAAATVARLAGLGCDAIREAVRNFRGVPHRLELVSEIDGVAFYNDSIATAPERTLAGMRSFSEPLVLLLGGRDKHLPLDELARECYYRCRAVVLFGEAAGLLEAAFARNRPSGAGMQLFCVESLAEAVERAALTGRPGDVVLLSPACTSFDAYRNFEERGAHFRSLVLARAQRQAGEKKEVA